MYGNMKNSIFLLIAVLGLTALLIINSDQGPVATSDQPPPVYRLRFGHNMPEDSALHQAAVRFSTLAKERSRGQVEVKIFPAQQLGDDHRMVEMARAGELDIILTPTAKLSTLVPEMLYVDLPFLFPQREDAYALLDGKVGGLLLEHLRPYGLQGVTIWENGFKHFIANRPVHTPDDFRGLKIRTMKSRIITKQFEALGATAIPIDFHSTYQALEDGVVDGQENPLVAITAMKLYEVQSHLILSGHAYLGYVFSFSDKTYQTLPIHLREMLARIARDITPWERAETRRREAGFLETIRKSGTAISTLSAEELQDLQVATQNIALQFRDIIGHDLMSATDMYLQEKYGRQQDDDIIIGLDADMSLGTARAGMAIQRGMELAMAEINEKGGVLGKKLAMIVLDHKGIPARGKSNFTRFAAMPNLVAVMGGKQGAVALPETKLAREHKLPFLIPWAAATEIIDNSLAENFVFRLSVRDQEAGKFLTNKALKISPRVGLLLENTVWGRSNKKAMTEALGAKGLSPAATAWFHWGDRDISPQLSSMERADVGVILLVANPPEGINVLKSLSQRNKKTPIISHWGITGGYFWEETRQELQDMDFSFLQTNCFFNGHRPRQNHFLQAYKTTYGLDDQQRMPAPNGSVHAYDLLHILARAINQAGSTDRSAIRAALENIDFHQGVLKNYHPPFSPQNHEALERADYRLAQYDESGRIRIHGTED